MEGKLKELTSKIYQEGVEKAKSEGRDIVEASSKQAQTILANAQNQARDIINNATKEAEQLKQKVYSELKMVGNQSINTLKQEITAILSKSSLEHGIKNAMNDTDFIKSLIKEMVSKWDSNSKDLVLTLPKKFETEMTTFFKTKAQDILSKGIELKFENRMDGGFKIGPKDNSYLLSFTDKEFLQFFQSYLKPLTKEILFSGE